MEILVFQKKYRARRCFFMTILVSALIGAVNMLLNKDQALSLLDGDQTSYVMSILTTIPLALVIQGFYVIVLSILLYFIAAAMDKGNIIKMFLILAAKVLICTPLINLCETFGIVFLKQKTTDLGIIGIIGYIPFFFLLWYYIYKLAPESLNLSRKQSVWMASIGAIVMIGISYPF